MYNIFCVIIYMFFVVVIFERLRNVLYEGKIDIRVRYMVEVMFVIRKDGFKDYQSVIQELDFIVEEDQFIYFLILEDEGIIDDIFSKNIFVIVKIQFLLVRKLIYI